MERRLDPETKGLAGRLKSDGLTKFSINGLPGRTKSKEEEELAKVCKGLLGRLKSVLPLTNPKSNGLAGRLTSKGEIGVGVIGVDVEGEVGKEEVEEEVDVDGVAIEFT